jgi:ABC-type uncharacterized transport system ATPase subunit
VNLELARGSRCLLIGANGAGQVQPCLLTCPVHTHHSLIRCVLSFSRIRRQVNIASNLSG